MKKQPDRRQSDRRHEEQEVPEDRRHNERRMQERRGSDRVEVEVWVEEHRDKESYLRRTRNLSAEGLFFDVALPTAVGTGVTLRFTLPGDTVPIVARGEVVNVGTGPGGLGMGIYLTEIDGDGKQRLRVFVEALQ
jgi:hypothetical protein